MRFSKHTRPEVNAGSMADIAFLLLIFFLVTAVIPNDKGLSRKLPRICPENTNCDADIHKRNILQIILNNNNEIMVNNEVISINELTKKAINFIDNNGDKSCEYCSGLELSTSSDNPRKAIISLQSYPNATYQKYIDIQDKLTKAYYKLRYDYAKRKFNKDFVDLNPEETKKVKEAYPFILSEAQAKIN